jgi:hypothetical protein
METRLGTLLVGAVLLGNLLSACGGGDDAPASTASATPTNSTGATPSGGTATSTPTGGTSTGTSSGGTTGTPTAPTAAPGSPTAGTASAPTATLTAAATVVPANSSSTIICAFPALQVVGTGMKNVELLPADTAAPVLGRFTVSADGTLASLPFDTNALPKGQVQVRILAFDTPPGQGGNAVVAMAPRIWNIGDPSQPPCLSPGLSGP